jgi:hypothetical protein
MRKRKKEELSKPSNVNPIAKSLGSSAFKPKVIQSKKLYNRKKKRIDTLNAAAKEGELND